MSQRQTREAELEKTVFDLGAALTAAQQRGPASSQTPTLKDDGVNYKEMFEGAAEELETLRVQFDMETQRREALQQELSDISKERSDEATAIQLRRGNMIKRYLTWSQLLVDYSHRYASNRLGAPLNRRTLQETLCSCQGNWRNQNKKSKDCPNS